MFCFVLLLYSTCTGGRWSCTTEKCPGECTVFGSGMFKSFDGKWFDTKRQCSYTLVAPTKLAVHKFFIYIDNRGCTNKFTDNCLKEVIVIQGGLRFRLVSLEVFQEPIGNNPSSSWFFGVYCHSGVLGLSNISITEFS